MSKGAFITFEGGEGAGKTTLIKKVSSYLESQKIDVLTTRAPGGTPFGASLREILLHSSFPLSKKSELFLFLADRAQHVEEVIAPALKEGKIVLCDRFIDSTIAYQAGARGIKRKQVEELSLFAGEDLMPDLTFFLDIPPEEGLKRGKGNDRLEKEKKAFHESLYETYLELAEENPKRIKKVDASLSPNRVFTKVMEILDAFL